MHAASENLILNHDICHDRVIKQVKIRVINLSSALSPDKPIFSWFGENVAYRPYDKLEKTGEKMKKNGTTHSAPKVVED